MNRTKDIYVYSLLQNPSADFAKVGFQGQPKIGDTIEPAVIGTASRFNSHGRHDVDKTLPKEARVVGQRKWRWTQFAGRYGRTEKERTVDVVRDCYPRVFIAPPSLEMMVLDVGSKLRLVTKVASPAADDDLKHAVNLYLEYFGVRYLTDDPSSVPIVTPRKVNWRLLPAGTSPFAVATAAVAGRLSAKSSDDQQIIMERQEFVCSLGPDAVYVGDGGFADYLAYVFTAKGIVVLESLTSGNAIYVFDRAWAPFSQLTKAEIIARSLHKERIIHATGWQKRLRTTI